MNGTYMPTKELRNEILAQHSHLVSGNGVTRTPIANLKKVNFSTDGIDFLLLEANPAKRKDSHGPNDAKIVAVLQSGPLRGITINGWISTKGNPPRIIFFDGSRPSPIQSR